MTQIVHEVVAFPAKKTVKKKTVKKTVDTVSNKEHKNARARRRTVMGGMLIGLGIGEAVLTALSLSHLAMGIALVTHSSEEATLSDWAFASTFDVVMLVMKLAMIFSKPNDYNKDLHKYGNIFVTGALTVSAFLNSLAFSAHTVGNVKTGIAVAFGIIVPASIYLITKAAASLYTDYSRG